MCSGNAGDASIVVQLGEGVFTAVSPVHSDHAGEAYTRACRTWPRAYVEGLHKRKAEKEMQTRGTGGPIVQ